LNEIGSVNPHGIIISEQNRILSF